MSRTEKALLIAACLIGSVSIVNAFAAYTPIPQVQHIALGQGITGLTYRHAFGAGSKNGYMTSTGSSATSTVTAGAPLKIVCDEWAHVGVRSSCSRDITNSAFCEPVKSYRDGDALWVMPNSSTMAIISADGGTANCAKFEMN